MGKLPSRWKGQQRECVICGWWFGELDRRIYKNRFGKWVCKWCDDTLTESERQEQIIRQKGDEK